MNKEITGTELLTASVIVLMFYGAIISLMISIDVGRTSVREDCFDKDMAWDSTTNECVP